MATEGRFAAAMAAVTRRLPFGLANVVAPNVVGYLLINLCTFLLDLGLLYVFHATFGLPSPVAVTLSYGSAGIVSYICNRIFNFQSHADVGKQFPVYVAVMVSNYFMFVLGLFDLLIWAGVYFEISRILAACCEGVYLYCCMRWLVFRDASPATVAETAAAAEVSGAGEPAATPDR